MRLSIRAKFFLATASVSILFVVTVVTPANHYVRGIVRNEVTASLRAGQLAFQRFLQLRQDVLMRRARSIAETPYVKATVSIPDVNGETVLYALQQIGELGDGDFVLATTETGNVLAHLGAGAAELDALVRGGGIEAALAGEERVTIWASGSRAYHVALSPIVSGERVAGIIALGTRIDEAFARDIHEFSGRDVVVLHGPEVLARSASRGETTDAIVTPGADRLSALGREVGGGAPDARAIREVAVAGRHSLAIVEPVLDSACRVVLYRGLDEMDESLRGVRNGIVAAGLTAVLLAVAVSFWVAGRVSGPIRRLRDTVRRFGPENLGLRVEVTSNDELGELGNSFNRMADRLAENAEELRHLAYFDPLTKLPNGAGFKEHLAATIERADRRGRSVAVLFLDLHRFKRVNDTLGHEQGDALLGIVAQRLSSCLEAIDEDGTDRVSGIVSRMSGDHFMLLLEGFSRTSNVADLARRLNERCSEPILLGTHEISVQTAIGISLFPVDGRDAPTLLKNADTAKQHAKAHGGLPYQFYSRALTVEAAKFMSLESDLRRALERDQLRLFAQPQVDVATGRVIGAEMLLRWMHPERGIVSPGVFVPLAEVTGLIVPIGEWVIREACREAALWQHLVEEPLRVGINISGVQFRPDLVGIVESAIEDAGLAPELVDLEITETVVMRTAEATIATLDELRSLGVTISIDDFGTGYSSLGYLKRFPIDKLKIDRSFMKDVTVRAEDAAITRAIIAMGHSLGFKVVAEGVETRDHLMFLEATGCDEAQGYIFSRPIPAVDIPELVNELSRRAA